MSSTEKKLRVPSVSSRSVTQNVAPKKKMVKPAAIERKSVFRRQMNSEKERQLQHAAHFSSAYLFPGREIAHTNYRFIISDARSSSKALLFRVFLLCSLLLFKNQKLVKLYSIITEIPISNF